MQTLPATPDVAQHAGHAPYGYGAPEPAPAPKGPGVLSRLAKLFGRLVVLAVFVAAAIGGWFGYERFIVPQLEGSVDTSTADAASPWPRELLRAPEPWAAFTASELAAGIAVRDVQIDTTTGAMRAATRGAGGNAVEVVEFAGGRAWISAANDPNWREIIEDELEAVWTDRLRFTEPPTLAALVPAEGLEHVVVVSEQEVDELSRFVVSIDAQGFRRSAPIAYLKWVDNVAGSDSPTLQWELWVARDGRVVELSRAGLATMRWEQLTTPIVLESPAATVAATPSGVVPESTGDAPVPPDAGGTEPGETAPAAEPWLHTTVTITENGDWRATRNFDRRTGVVQDLTADWVSKLEFVRTEGQQLDNGAWRSLADAGFTADDIAALHDAFRLQADPPLLGELVPPAVPFVETTAEEPIEGGRRLTLVYDLEGWSTTHPESYQQLIDTSLSLLGDGNATLVVDLYGEQDVIHRMTDGAGAYVYTWTQRIQPIALVSPLAVD